jgi:quercetin dioxygenase-like cupin family protein
MLQGTPLDGWEGRFFHSENMTFAYWDVAAGAADLHEHSHEQEEVWHVLEGEISLTVDGEERRLGPTMVAVVPPNTSHSVQVVGACRALVADYPLRPNLPGAGKQQERRSPPG